MRDSLTDCLHAAGIISLACFIMIAFHSIVDSTWETKPAVTILAAIFTMTVLIPCYMRGLLAWWTD